MLKPYLATDKPFFENKKALIILLYFLMCMSSKALFRLCTKLQSCTLSEAFVIYTNVDYILFQKIIDHSNTINFKNGLNATFSRQNCDTIHNEPSKCCDVAI